MFHEVKKGHTHSNDPDSALSEAFNLLKSERGYNPEVPLTLHTIKAWLLATKDKDSQFLKLYCSYLGISKACLKKLHALEGKIDKELGALRDADPLGSASATETKSLGFEELKNTRISRGSVLEKNPRDLTRRTSKVKPPEKAHKLAKKTALVDAVEIITRKSAAPRQKILTFLGLTPKTYYYNKQALLRAKVASFYSLELKGEKRLRAIAALNKIKELRGDLSLRNSIMCGREQKYKDLSTQALNKNLPPELRPGGGSKRATPDYMNAVLDAVLYLSKEASASINHTLIFLSIGQSSYYSYKESHAYTGLEMAGHEEREKRFRYLKDLVKFRTGFSLDECLKRLKLFAEPVKPPEPEASGKPEETAKQHVTTVDLPNKKNETIFEAIKERRGGKFDVSDQSNLKPTNAIPGTREKLEILAERARLGLPLWHDDDRADYD